MSLGTMTQNPIKLLVRAVWLKLQGRARLERDVRGTHVEVDGERFVAFRKVVVVPVPAANCYCARRLSV